MSSGSAHASPGVASANSSSSLVPQNWQWVFCDHVGCGKSRRLPGNAVLPDGEWFCEMNPDLAHNSCDHEQEASPEPSPGPTWNDLLELDVNKKSTLLLMCKYLDIPTWGTKEVLTERIKKSLEKG